ncbi:hypothetical protein ACLOJK_041353 [Asimina triloba]
MDLFEIPQKASVVKRNEGEMEKRQGKETEGGEGVLKEKRLEALLKMKLSSVHAKGYSYARRMLSLNPNFSYISTAISTLLDLLDLLDLSLSLSLTDPRPLLIFYTRRGVRPRRTTAYGVEYVPRFQGCNLGRVQPEPARRTHFKAVLGHTFRVTGLGHLGGSRRNCDFVFLASVAGSAIVRRQQRHPLLFPFPEPFLFLQQRGARPDHHNCQRPPSPISAANAPHLPHLHCRQRRRFQPPISHLPFNLSSDHPPQRRRHPPAVGPSCRQPFPPSSSAPSQAASSISAAPPPSPIFPSICRSIILLSGAVSPSPHLPHLRHRQRRRFQQRPPSPIFPSICHPIILLSGAVILPPSALPPIFLTSVQIFLNF